MNFRLHDSSLEIGYNVHMGPNVTVFGGEHRFDSIEIPINSQGDLPKSHLIVGDDVWNGYGVTFLRDAHRIRNHAVVGACAVVTRDVPDCAVVGENPAKIIRYRNASGDN